jgi:HEAT repeat protein
VISGLIASTLTEVVSHQERVAALETLPLAGFDYQRPMTILTSRPLGQRLPFQLLTTIELQGLTPQEQTQVLERYRSGLSLTEAQVTEFRAQVLTNPQGRLPELLTRPGHLVQLLTLYHQTGTLPTTETELFEQLLAHRLTITGRSHPPVESDDPEHLSTTKRQVLDALAVHLLACRQNQRHTRTHMLALIRQVLQEQKKHGQPLFPLSQAPVLLNDFVHNSGLLRRVGFDPEYYEFETVIWLQHLTGCGLAKDGITTALGLTNEPVLEFLDKKAWDPEWEPVLKSWVGTAPSPFPFLQRLTNKDHDDLARHRLGTAGRCLFEVPAELRVNSQYQTLATQILTEAFTVWKAEAERGTEKLIETSLRGAWVETEVWQANLKELLMHENEALRIKAVEKLGEAGTTMMETVQQALATALSDEEQEVAAVAAEALGQLGTAIPASVQQTLVRQLTDVNEHVSCRAAEILGRLGSAMPEMVQLALVAQLENLNEKIREAVVEALKGLGGTMSVRVQKALVARLADADEKVRRAAVRSLDQAGAALMHLVSTMDAKQVCDLFLGLVNSFEIHRSILPGCGEKRLLEKLASDDEIILSGAVWMLGRFECQMLEVVEAALIGYLKGFDVAVRTRIVEMLLRLGPSMPLGVQEALVTHLKDVDEGVRLAATEALSELGTAMPEIVQEALVANLPDTTNWEIRREAVRALSDLGVAMLDRVQPVLVAWLKDEDWCVRAEAVNILGSLGRAMSEPAQDALITCLKDHDFYVRAYAVRVLDRLGYNIPASSLDDIVEHLVPKHSWSKYEPELACELLDGLRTPIPLVAQLPLVKCMEHWDDGVRFRAADCLQDQGALLSTAAQQALIGCLVNQRREIRWHVTYVLSGMGVNMPIPVQAALVERFLDDRDESVRTSAAMALGRLGSSMPMVVQTALTARVAQLTDTRPSLMNSDRKAALEALGNLGSAMPVPAQSVLVAQVRMKISWAKKWLRRVVAVQSVLIARKTDEEQRLNGWVRVWAVKVLEALRVKLSAFARMESWRGNNDWVLKAAATALYSAQHHGLRLFHDGTALGPGRLVSDLSATIPFPDECLFTVNKRSSFLAVS